MEPIVLLMNKWGATFQLPVYLLFGGMAGGLLLTSACFDLFGWRSERASVIARLACYLALPSVVLGGIFLTFHLGKPERGIFFPLYFTNTRSWLTVGGWIIGIYTPISVALVALWFFEVRRLWRVILDVAAIPASIAIAMYTGFLLSGAGFVPLWDRGFLPGMFLISGITSGVAAVGLGAILARIVGWPRPIRKVAPHAFPGLVWVLCIPLVLLLALEAADILSFLQFLADGGPGQKVAYAYVTGTGIGPWLWWGVMGVGIGLPMLGSLVCLATGRRAALITFPTFGLVLVGAFIFRFVIVWGGEVKKPLIFPPQKWPIPAAQVAPGSAQALSRTLGRIRYNR